MTFPNVDKSTYVNPLYKKERCPPTCSDLYSDELRAGIKPARGCKAASFKIKYYKPYRPVVSPTPQSGTVLFLGVVRDYHFQTKLMYSSYVNCSTNVTDYSLCSWRLYFLTLLFVLTLDFQNINFYVDVQTMSGTIPCVAAGCTF